jgi:hypothetical protein
MKPGVGLHLGVMLGPEFQAMTTNFALNLREKRVGVLSAVMLRGI